jgi:cytochrome c oxidase subunit IV
MSASDVEAIRKQTRIYVGVFIALAIGTVLTVAVSYLHMPVVVAILIALLIASFKGSLVAAFFMHLSHERKVIYWVLLLTVVFFLALMFIPSLTEWNQRYLPR